MDPFTKYDLLNLKLHPTSLLDKKTTFKQNFDKLQEYAKASVHDNESWSQFINHMMGVVKNILRPDQLEQMGEWARQAIAYDARELFAQKLIAIACGEPFDDESTQTKSTELEMSLEKATSLVAEGEELIRVKEGHLKKYQSKLNKLGAELKRHKKTGNTKAFEHLSRDFNRLNEQITNFEQQLIDYRAKVEEARLRVTAAKKHPISIEEAVRDIEITVGHLAFPSLSGGNIPIYAVIECWFPTTADVALPERLLLSWEDRRYKIYAPGKKNSPIAECDAPIEEKDHEIFQRLREHWGYWFMRVNGTTRQWDFQIINEPGPGVFSAVAGSVETLENPIELSLYTLGCTRAEIVADFDRDVSTGKNAFAHEDDRDKLMSMLDKLEALVGPLPCAKRGLPRVAGKINAWVIHRSDPVRTQWITIDQDKLVQHIRKVVGGNFFSVVFESVRCGVDFLQVIGDQKDRTQPDIWFRVAQGVAAESMGETGVVESIGRKLPLEKFAPEALMSLEEDDQLSVLRHYRKTKNGHDNNMRTVARVQQLPQELYEDSTEVDKETHEAIVQNYLHLCQIVRVAAGGGDANATRVWPHLRDAVIFEMPGAAYMSLYEEFFTYCVRVAKVDPKIPLAKHTDKQRERVMNVLGTGRHAPFPDKMPFRACFFAYGRGVRDANSELIERELRNTDPSAPHAVGKLYGHLVTSTGIVVSFRHIEQMSNAQEGLAFVFDRDPEQTHNQEWERPYTMAPWIVNALVSYVNEHKKLVEAGPNGFAHRALVKKIAKGLSMKAPVPPPFYVVYLKDEFIRERARTQAASIKLHIEWQHRWHVRGHDCLKFQRGPLPIDPGIERELLKRGYKIFTETAPDAETFLALAKRGVAPKAQDEWIAVLAYWREPFIKGPEGKPLIESVRRSAKGWEPS